MSFPKQSRALAVYVKGMELSLEECWRYLRAAQPEPAPLKGYLWLGLLAQPPYQEVSAPGYTRRAVAVSKAPYKASFTTHEEVEMRGVGLWADSQKGVPIYWRECQLIRLGREFELEVVLDVTISAPQWLQLLERVGVV